MPKKKALSWPASNPEQRLVKDLKKNPHNARVHPPEQIDMVVASIREFGWTIPILIDEKDVMLAGHARLEAAGLLGIKEVPVIVARGWTADQKRAYVEADNRLGELAGWDNEIRREELASLVEAGFPMESIGWADSALAEFLETGTIEGKDPEETPDPPKVAIVRPGEVWELEGHRIICGDGTKPEVWQKLFAGERQKAAMVFTDPPYGVSYEARSGDFDVIQGDHKRRDDLYKMLVQSFRMMAKWTAEGAAFYIWHASSTRTDFSQAMTAAGIVERQYLIWAKPTIGLGYSDYRWTHEPCFYASKQAKSPKFYGDKGESTVWRVEVSSQRDTATVIGPGVLLLDGKGNSLYVQQRAPKTKKPREVRIGDEQSVVLMEESGTGTVWEVSRDRDYEHPTQKPVELATRAIDNSSQRDQIVVDGFAGSGTAIIAAEMLGRRCFAIEIDPIYVQVCIERWQNYSGHMATLDGMPFNEIEKSRKKGKGKEKRGNAKGHTRKPIPIRSRPEGADRPVAEPEVREEVSAAQSDDG